MKPSEYVRLAVKTEAPVIEAGETLQSRFKLRALHSAMGMCTEAGEMQDQLKRHIFYGKDLDLVNIQEEVGDMLWYCALMCDVLDIDMSTVMERNIAKLQARYPDKFKKSDALDRDLDAERRELEGVSDTIKALKRIHKNFSMFPVPSTYEASKVKVMADFEAFIDSLVETKA